MLLLSQENKTIIKRSGLICEIENGLARIYKKGRVIGEKLGQFATRGLSIQMLEKRIDELASPDITFILQELITPSETRYDLDHTFTWEGRELVLIGVLEFVLHVTPTWGDHNNPPEIKEQYVLNVIDDLKVFNSDQEEIVFHYDKKFICKIFEI